MGGGLRTGVLPGGAAASRAMRRCAAATLLLAASLVASVGARAVPSGCGSPACVNLAGFASDDYDLGSWNGAANTVRVNLRHCVFSNRPSSGTKTYDANAVGVGTTGGAFLLAGPGGDLPYDVEIDDGSGFVVMTAGVDDNFNSLSEAAFDSCTNSATSAGGQRLRVTVYETDMEGYASGTYTGTLRLNVATPVGSGSDFETNSSLSIEIPPLVRLSGLRNTFGFGTWNPDSGDGLELADNAVCIWSNNAADTYTVTATTATGAFEMLQAGDPIAFDVWWSGQPGISTVAASETMLDYNVPESFTTDATVTNCSGDSTASIVLAVSESALASAVSGAYAADLLITIGLAP